jgi:hypothetical protein
MIHLGVSQTVAHGPLVVYASLPDGPYAVSEGKAM